MPAAAVAVPAPGGASPAAQVSQHSVVKDAAVRKTGRTRVVVKVKDCKTCVITLISAPRPPAGEDEPVFWSSRDTRVKRGKVTFRVPAAHTEGLYLTVRDRRAVSTGAMAIAVARYAGQRVGAKVSPRKAARTKRGFHCVAAVAQPKVVWKLRVDRFPGRDAYTGKRGYQIRPYLVPTQDSFGDSMRLSRGVAGAQDIAFCQRTP